MTPFPKNIGKVIGRAKRLLFLLVEQAPADWTGEIATYVANGNMVTDADLGERLGVSVETAARWRRTLRMVRVIDWLVSPGEGRVFRIAARELAQSRKSCSTGNKRQTPRRKW